MDVPSSHLPDVFLALLSHPRIIPSSSDDKNRLYTTSHLRNSSVTVSPRGWKVSRLTTIRLQGIDISVFFGRVLYNILRASGEIESFVYLRKNSFKNQNYILEVHSSRGISLCFKIYLNFYRKRKSFSFVGCFRT